MGRKEIQLEQDGTGENGHDYAGSKASDEPFEPFYCGEIDAFHPDDDELQKEDDRKGFGEEGDGAVFQEKGGQESSRHHEKGAHAKEGRGDIPQKAGRNTVGQVPGKDHGETAGEKLGENEGIDHGGNEEILLLFRDSVGMEKELHPPASCR